MLKIWLPYNKDGRMVGLSPTSATSYSNATIVSETTPITGKCINTCGVIYHMATDEFANEFSIALWGKHDGGFPQYNTILSCKNTSASTSCHWYFSVISGNSLYFAVNDAAISGSYQFQPATWYHFAATYDGKILKEFVNGVFVKSGVTTVAKKEGCVNVGIACRSTNNAGTSITGDWWKMNDVRIYSHALTETEIKDISNCKAFDAFGGLFLEETTNLVSNIASAGEDNVAYDVATWATTVSYVTNKNGVYTFSAYITNTSDHPLNCRLSCYNSAGTGYNAIQGNTVPAGSEGYSIVTCDTTNTSNFNGTIYLYIQNGNAGVDPTNKRFYLKRVQFEEKGHATPLSYGHRDSRVVDITNFNHDITPSNIIKSGSSIYFNGTDASVLIPLHEIISGGTWTLNMWFNKHEYSSKGYDTIVGGPSGFEIETKSAATNVNKVVLWNWGKLSCDYEFDRWNMLTMSRTPTAVKLYLNGELKATGTTVGSMPAGNYFLGAWQTATAQNYKGYLRNFSVYKKELTQEDITNLYEHGK